MGVLRLGAQGRVGVGAGDPLGRVDARQQVGDGCGGLVAQALCFGGGLGHAARCDGQRRHRQGGLGCGLDAGAGVLRAKPGDGGAAGGLGDTARRDPRHQRRGVEGGGRDGGRELAGRNAQAGIHPFDRVHRQLGQQGAQNLDHARLQAVACLGAGAPGIGQVQRQNQRAVLGLPAGMQQRVVAAQGYAVQRVGSGLPCGAGLPFKAKAQHIGQQLRRHLGLTCKNEVGRDRLGLEVEHCLVLSLHRACSSLRMITRFELGKLVARSGTETRGRRVGLPQLRRNPG